jgi:hypothetical protein
MIYLVILHIVYKFLIIFRTLFYLNIFLYFFPFISRKNFPAFIVIGIMKPYFKIYRKILKRFGLVFLTKLPRKLIIHYFLINIFIYKIYVIKEKAYYNFLNHK